MSLQTVIFASTNSGKFEEFKRLSKFNTRTLKLSSLRDLPYEIPQCEETGNTFQENALLKVNHTYAHLRPEHKQSIIIGDDSGMSIKALDGEPGVHTRRWVGHVMTDEEIVSHCLDQLKNKTDRTAEYVTAYAILAPHLAEPYVIQHSTRGKILKQLRQESYASGIPFRALFYIPEVALMFHDARELPENKRAHVELGHEIALQDCRSYIDTLLELINLSKVLNESWTAGTSYWPEEWQQSIPSSGQCAVTALIIQDLFGGELMRCKAESGNTVRTHFYNVLSNKLIVDMTKDQFDEDTLFIDRQIVERSSVLNHPDTVTRYEMLKNNLSIKFNKDELLPHSISFKSKYKRNLVSNS